MPKSDLFPDRFRCGLIGLGPGIPQHTSDIFFFTFGRQWQRAMPIFHLTNLDMNMFIVHSKAEGIGPSWAINVRKLKFFKLFFKFLTLVAQLGRNYVCPGEVLDLIFRMNIFTCRGSSARRKILLFRLLEGLPKTDKNICDMLRHPWTKPYQTYVIWHGLTPFEIETLSWKDSLTKYKLDL